MYPGALSILNPNPTKLPGPTLLHHLVTPACHLQALEYQSRGQRTSYTYRHLHDVADAIACHISDARRRAGRHQADFIVPVLIPQSPLLYISLLAILKAGGAFCPLNIDAPPERIKFLLKDVSAEVVLVSSALASKLPLDTGTDILQVDRVSTSQDHGPREHRQPSPADLAYVMYTSGSTGTPKGVGVSHAAATQALLAHDAHVPSFSRFLQFAAPTFDVSVFETFFPLFRGATLIAACRDEMLDDLPSVLRDMNVDACELTPTVAASLLRNRHNAPNLKLLLTIGEMLSTPIVKEFGGSQTKPSILWAMYGPTEAAIHCTLQTALSSDSTISTIGIPLDTVSCFIIEPCSSSSGSSSFRALPWGEIGELAVGGHQLARGYLNRPEQTASAFISSPYGRLYRTGDRARLTADGKLECLGRLANGQVKLRGQRIELGEIEQAALSTPGCHGAVAAVVDSNLVVFCAVDPDATEDAIVMHCKQWLPLFMVPGEVIMLAELPRLPSGKVDTQRLRSSYGEQKLADLGDSSSLGEFAEAEEEIIHVVTLTLGLKVSRRMTLASAGVDSLSAIRLASALRLSGFVTTAPELLKLNTISDICFSIRNRPVLKSVDLEPLNVSLMADLSQLLAHNPGLSLEEHHVEDVLPCTPLQSAMLAETVRDARLYSNEMELRAAPGLVPDDVVDAIRQVAQRNEILRTGFAQWCGGFAAILYKAFGTTDTLQTVREFRHGLAFTKPQDFLRPLRFQMRADADGTGLRLLVQAHHAVYDGWSMDAILSDLSALLRRAPLPPRPQFREVLNYHARDSKKAADDLDRRFWSEHLLGWSKSPFPRLTAQFSVPSEMRTTRRTLKILPSQVQEVANQAALSTQVLFQASLALLWSGIVGEQDVMLGSVTSGRTIPVDRIEEVIGPCIASLPLRVNLDSMVSYADLLKNIQVSNRAIMEHCGLPLSDIKKLAELQPTESLYDVLFVFQESFEAKKESVRLFTEVGHMDRLETKLLFEIQPDKSNYTAQVTYHSSWFPPGLVECLIQQLESILSILLDDPESRIQRGLESTIPGQSIYNESSQSPSEIPDLAVQIEARAAKMPGATALCFMGSSQTISASYRELNENANQVAHYLGSCDIAIGEVLAIIMKKSPIFYTSVLGIVKAGCAYLPILPATPEARVREILKQARIKHCLVDSASSALLFVDDVQFHEMESGKLVSYPKENRSVPADPSRLAYVIYTSGTTGEPKGVAVTQKNIVSNITFLHSTYPAPKSVRPRLLQACSQAFDVSVFEIFFTWHAGMCLCAAVNDDMFEDLENSIRQLDITHLSLTPTVVSLIDPENVPDVEFLVTAGEPMTLSVLDRWGDRLWQGYGPSETTNICSVKRMKRGDNIEHLGWALPNTSTFVLRPSSLGTVPTGWVGEFCFGGDQVAMGYLNDARLTTEKFLDHPKFGRIYRSGDVGRMLPDGSLMIIGRLDDQIKLRGQRIEAGEVNGIITSTGLAVSAVTVSAQREKGASDQLVSFFVPPGADAEFGPVEIDQEATRHLFASLSSLVPSYMVPSYLVPVSQIPVGFSGKLDRRRLQACFESLARDYLEAAASTTQSLDDETDWTRGESVIAEVLAHSTKVPTADIRRWTPFAALGVDSISAIDVSRVLNSKLGTLIPISAILQNPTVAQLAKYVEATDKSQRKAVSQHSNAFAATFADEEGMLSQGTRSYFNKILLRLRIRAEDMRTYWDVVSQRHGILRTCFVTTRRAAHPIAQVVLRTWDVSWRSFEVNEPSLAGAIQEHLGCLPDPLDSWQPPVSCAFMRYKGTTFFSLICHHATYDGVAMENLWREIEALANGRALPPPVAYKPFIQQVISLPKDTDAFWIEQFRDFKPSILFTRLAGADINQCTHTTSLGITLHDVQRSLRSLGVSLLCACQAAWATLVSIACGCPDIAFGNVINGRTVDLEGLDRLVAPCFNTVPLRVDLSRSPQYIDLARHFQDLNARMLRYQFTSLRHPLKDMDEGVWTLEEDSGDMDVPLVCEVVPCPGLNSIVVNIHYDIGIVSGDTAAALADTFKCVFGRLIDLPFTSPCSRSTLPEMLQLGLADLVPRHVKPGGGDRQQSENETWSDSEKSLRQILSELSGVPEERISRHTSIFRLGLDSINAVQVASILKRKGYKLSASDVIRYSNCARLAPRLVRVSEDDTAQERSMEILNRYASEVSTQISSAVPSGLGEHAEAVLPATPMQAAMLAAFIQSQGNHYLNMLKYHINDNVHIDEVLHAWEVLHRRHPMLRTGFASVSHKESPFAMIRHAEVSIQAPKWQDESRRLFLQCPHLPPWKVVLVNYGDEVLMNLAIHHALYDAYSLEELLVATNVSSNRELMREMMGYNVELHNHQFSPLSQIQKWLGHSATPVFDTLVIYQRRERIGQGSWTLVNDDLMVEYAVSLEIEPTSAEDVCLRLTFAKDVLPQEQASLLVQQFDATLQHLIREPDDDEHGLYQKRADLFAITAAASPVLPAPVPLLHEFVEWRSTIDPDSTALEFVSGFDSGPATKRWSYRELDLMGNRVANLLRETTSVGDIVAIHFQKCPEAYFSILGILKAGCSFVALDPHAPIVRKDFILRDCHAKYLVTDLQSTLDFEYSTSILRIGEELLQGYSDGRPALKERRLTPSHTCYCLYTSGTTGTPKGCEISHENAVQAMMAFQELFRGHWEHDSRWLQFAALHFDVSVLEQYWSWSVGITVVAAPRDLILDDLTGVINRLGITHIDLTPSLARLTRPDEMPSLCRGVFITGGEQLRQEILDKWGPKAVIYNAYGPTEATIGVTMYQRVPVNGRPSNIGQQFPNVGSYIFHPGTEIPVLRGAIGELCVSGKLVGKGYLNRPELTEERFPTLAEFGERVYRTGDLVRILYDGCFEFLGRADDQIKLRGQRLEIGEINHAVRTGVPDIQNVATILVRREASGKDVLVSFFVGQQHGGSQDLSFLQDTDCLGAKARAACLERLPTYMVPSYFLRLPYIPLSPNNKVEARELKSVFEQLSHEQLMKLSAATAASQDRSLDKIALGKIIRLVSEFSTVPGDTILAMLLRSNGFPAASPAMLLRCPVIADLVNALSTNAAARPQANSVREARQLMQACHHRYLGLVCRELGVEPDEIEYIAPCSPLQQGITFKATQEDGSGTYFNSFELRLGNDASLEKVRRSWSRLVDFHAILRSVFVNTPEGYIQAALKQPKSPWRELTVQVEDEINDVMSTEMRRWIHGNKHHIVNPFELIHVHGPGFQRVFIHIFHALYDGNSLELMSQYASALYHDDEPTSGPLFVEALTSGPLQSHDHCRQFWIEYMQGWVSSPLPALQVPPGEHGAVAATRNVSLGRFEELRSQQNVTLQSVVLSLWAAVLQRHLTSKTTIGVVIAGRSIDLPNVERTIGPMFNTVPFFINALRGHTWASLIRETHTYSTSILPFQHVPLKSIQKWCSGGRSLFDNLFVFQIEQPNLAGEGAPWTIEDGPSQPDYTLAFEATRTLEGELRVSLVAQSCFADLAMLEDILDQFEHEVGTVQAEGLVNPSPADEELREPAAKSWEDGEDSDTMAASFEWTDRAVLVREELGLDSIDTMKLSARLKRKAINLSSSSILRCQNISRMVQQLELYGYDSPPIAQNLNPLQEMRLKLRAQVEKAGVDLDTVESVLPPTALQEAMVAGMVQSGFQWYFNHDILEVAEWVDVERLSKAWEDLVESSPILRTGFVEVDDADLDMAYCQVTFQDPTLHIRTVSLSDISEVNQITMDATQLALEGQGLRDLLQLTFVALDEQRFVVLSMAHALYDGWSLGLMYRDLEAAYKGRVEARMPVDSFISRMLASGTTEAHEFWASYLAGLRPTFLAEKDKLTEATSESSSRRIRKETASKKTLFEVKQFCRKKSISLQALCAASWAMVVAEQVGALDVVFGVTLSGRDGEGAEALMFPTMNTVAIRCILHGYVSGFLQYMEASMADVRGFQAFPLRKAHAAAKLRNSDMFDSLFLFQRSPETEDLNNKMLRSIKGESAVEYPVCAEAEASGNRLMWRIACHEQLFSSEETEALVDKADCVLQFMLEHENADVLSFHGEDVSICGMPAVSIRETPATDGVAIRDILSQVSQVPAEAITPRSNLYQLGLDSISAIKVSILLRKRGIYLKPRELVRLSTIHEIASTASLEKKTEEPTSRAAARWAPPAHIDTQRLLRECGLRQESVDKILPATPMQVYMLTVWQNSAGSVFFPEFCYRVNGAVEESQVRGAWKSLVEEVPILRARFVATGSRELPWLQMVIRKEEVRSCRVSQHLACLKVTRDESGRGLGLRLKIHHALYDGFSLPALVSRLCELLNGGSIGDEQGLSRWARYCIAPCLSEAKRRRQIFWTAYLGEGAATSSSVMPSTVFTERVLYLDGSAIKDIGRLRVTASQSGISLQSLFLAGLATALDKRNPRGGRESMVLGIYLANQTADEGDSPQAVFPTLNLAPLKVQLGHDDEGLVTLARAIQDDIHSLSSDGRAEVGLWEIMAWTGVKVDCFVNFLADLPSASVDTDSDRQAAVTLTPVQDPGDASTTNNEDSDSALLEQPWVQRNAVRDAFPPSVDVEASVQDLKLAMGIFGLRTRVSDGWAAGLVADTAALLDQAGVEQCSP
ncbi:AMP-binding enzyme domain-containing protein [Hirsutella rhossiliensis]|uniref:AMP-binding enzyme domain-containing protein n=1 Tax=Hirsutella rhossiliensis TaxID=111463 RepID=A0A9P8SEN2_9HYPO|nr:AMP-binding enzyme domain-containing protein [Hirsutella rhossiliensis]KAH0958535.1 AMP-binding enzyme domain-containing protein [Hirsutella rhossiliensis]